MKANKLREIRARRGMTLSALAIRADVEPSLLSLVERGKGLAPKTAERLAGALGLPVKTVFPNLEPRA